MKTVWNGNDDFQKWSLKAGGHYGQVITIELFSGFTQSTAILRNKWFL